ncbi:putative cytochrome P450 28d1 [Lucilia cuprina]|nr:putative cytochrome P450 28d1 [Lucilia cuprina]
MLLITLWLLLAVIFFIYIFLIWNFNYWKRHDVNGPKPEIIFGNLPSAITKKRHFMYDLWDIYDSYKQTDDFVGIFKNRTPQLLILNPALARRIFVNDFKHFHDNEQVKFIDEKIDFLFANNPFVAGGEKWKERRSQITPGLTQQRIKNMFPVTLEICKHMCSYIEEQIKMPAKEGIDGKDLSSRFMADVIADCVMGLKSDSFKDRHTSPLLIMQNQMFEYSFLYSTLVGLFPGILKFYKQRFLTKKFEEYFLDLMAKAVELRKVISADKSMEERADFLNYLLQLQEKKNLTQMEISAHTMTFVLDGFETVSSILAHSLLMLARHPEVQQKVRSEIHEKVGSQRNFEVISDLPYLNACIHEILRFFPVVFSARKVCTETIKLTNRNRKSYQVPKGLVVVIPQYPIMMDENIYPNPMEFQPERFLEENGGVKKYFDMGAYWGYGDGPRICLGVRFGLVQIKAALVEILSKFVIKPNPKTRSDYTFDPTYYLARLDAFIILFYLFLISNFNYWKKFGIVSPKPLPFVGNYPSVLTQKRHIAYDIQDLYEKYKHTENFVGIFSCRSPQLLITNGELVRRIYSTDFKHFHDNEASRMVDDKSDFLFANNPFSLTGEKLSSGWKERRAEITPGLTISRVKTVYPITKKVCKNMTKYIEEQIKIGAKEGIEAKDLCLRFTSEVVTDCVLGLEAKSFEPKPSPIMAMITQIFEQNLIFVFYSILLGLFPSLSNYFKIRFFPKKSEEFFIKIMQDSIEMRKSQKKQGLNEDRIDFMNYILQLQEKKNLATIDLAAHTMTFLSDGFETTESIRLFPPGFFSNKLCTEPIELMNKNGKSFVVPKNTVVVLPLYSVMVDGDYYTNPNQFEPERFLEENGGLKKYKDLGVYYGFGEGPRACLGMRFALAQLKTALVEIIRQFEVSVNPKTRKDNELDPNYWKKRGIKGPTPKPFVGNFPSVFTQKRHLAEDIKEIYESYRKTDNFVGVFNCRSPQLLITNAELVRRILATDFKHFHDNEASLFVDKNSDSIFSENPFVLTGEDWKERRAEITPGFTQNRIKNVFPVTKKVCKVLTDYIEKETKLGPKDGIECKELSLRFTCEVVSDCVLGLQANSFTDSSAPIFDNAKKLFEQSFILILYMTLAGLIPSLTKIKKLRFVPKPIEDFFLDLMKNSLSLRKDQREKGVNEDRVDFMNYMLQLQEKKNLTITEVTSHTMTFLVDGFETTASVLSHCLLLLGRHPDKQDKLRKEIFEKLGHDSDFDTIMDLEYLDACIHETLRIFSPGSHSTKLCTEPIDLVNKDGKTLHVPVGTRVVLPIYAIMTDEENYKNANVFEPERFLNGGLKMYKDKGLFYAFGDGPRVCLGQRFALTQMKAAMVEIVRKFKIHVNPKTRKDNKLDPTYFILRLDGGIWLDFEKSYKNTDYFIGVFNSRCPQLMILNPEMIRRVYVTDFKHFHDNEVSTFIDEKSDKIFSNNPFVLCGEQWKERRAEVTPGLTHNRIKTVFPVTNKVCKTMVDYIAKQSKIGDGIEAKDLSLRYTCEVVTDCVLGLQANTFSDDPTPIFDNTKKLFDQSFVLILYMTLVGLIPSLAKIKKLRFVPKPIENFFIGLMESSLSLRKSQHEQGVNEDRVDFINYMLHLQEKKTLSLPELTSHTMTFLLDGFDTTANALSHCLLLLARYPEKQEKLREEILQNLGQKNNDYETILGLEYLDACIHETIRMFPPGSHSSKLCTQPIDLVNKDGRTLHVAVGTRVILPIYAVMNDEDYYKNANSFEPERLVDGGLKTLKDKGLFFGFGDGPRACLGMRFALTQIKGALVAILRNYKISVNPKTLKDNKLNPTYFALVLDGGMWLDFEKIN